MPILAAPYVLPAQPAPVSWAGIAEQRWTGADGSEWVLTGQRSGVRFAPGVRGMHFPPVTRYSSSSPAIAGSRSRGHRTEDREVFWPIHIYADGGSQAWLEYDRAFWSTMMPGKSGVWTVVHADGAARSLTCIAQHDGDHAYAYDPSRVGWCTYGLRLIAEQPYWEGDAVTRTWEASESVNFFDPVGYPYMFHISSGSSFTTATIDNPGDVDAYPIWQASGPITSAAVGVDGHVVELTAPIAEGETRIIDTRPDRLTVLDQNGVDHLDELGQAEFVPVPAGASVPLSVAVVGTGTITLTLVPLYHRAW